MRLWARLGCAIVALWCLAVVYVLAALVGYVMAALS